MSLAISAERCRVSKTKDLHWQPDTTGRRGKGFLPQWQTLQGRASGKKNGRPLEPGESHAWPLCERHLAQSPRPKDHVHPNLDGWDRISPPHRRAGTIAGNELLH
jgi:hypothetical protein